MLYFKIQQFLEYKRHCSICGVPLTPFLKDRRGGSLIKNLPNINSRLIEEEFKFKLQYTSSTFSIDKRCSVNVISNKFLVEDFDFDKNILTAIEIARVFEYFYTVIELHCNNSNCKHNYYVTSTNLKCTIDSETGISIANFLPDVECYNLSNFWIQNDLISHVSNVYPTSANKMFIKPISIPVFDLNPSNKDKVFNKIRTIINFS